MGQLLSLCKKEDGELSICDDNCDYSTINVNCVNINYGEKNESFDEKNI